ncbi:MAG: putative L,D-transpeptidase YkuD [Actinobacteria bacterium ADurb.BinA094]|nr:MAG: putative L,D-transpeptidase YkuD [Actinobacteria bacterium ADurb.BinA094]
MTGARLGIVASTLAAALWLLTAAAPAQTAAADRAAGLGGAAEGQATVLADEPAPSPTVAPALTLTARPATITAGDPVDLVAALGIPGATVRLSRKTAAHAGFVVVGVRTTDGKGVARFRVLPRQTTAYRVEYEGDGATWLAASAETLVPVRPRLTFSAPTRVYRDRAARLAVTVRPAHPGATVLVQRQVDGAWRDWRSVTLGADSRARVVRRIGPVGAVKLRVVMAADAGHLAGRSGVRRVQVVKPNPYRVPLGAKGIIVVDISEYTLRFYSYGRLLKAFPCVTGRPGLPTPIGRFKIYARGMWPGGPYGSRIMSYHPPCAIHGTNEPHLLRRFPRNFSHGCTRLYNSHAIWLYDHAPLGTPVWNVP